MVDAGLAASRSDARRLAEQGGLRVNDLAALDPLRVITAQDLSADGTIKLQAGKKKIVLVHVV
jgi:tyrosyl-tRNA synthetase